MNLKVEKVNGKRLKKSCFWIAEIYGTDKIWKYKRFFLNRVKLEEEEYYELEPLKCYDIRKSDSERDFYYCDNNSLKKVDEGFIKKRAIFIDRNCPEYQEKLDKLKEEKEEKYQERIKEKNRIKQEKRKKRVKFLDTCRRFKRYAVINNFLVKKTIEEIWPKINNLSI